MQYNAPYTVYFRQARSIQEIAKKDFENLRHDSVDIEPQLQPKVARRGGPSKSLKKSMDTSPSDHLASEFSSNATPSNGGDNTSWSSANYIRRGSMTSFRHRLVDASIRASPRSHTGETYTSWASEWENEFPASVVKAVMKYGKKLSTLEENKRDAGASEGAVSEGLGSVILDEDWTEVEEVRKGSDEEVPIALGDGPSSRPKHTIKEPKRFNDFVRR